MNFKFLNIPVQIRPTFWIFLLFFTNLYIDPSIEKLILGGVLLFSLLVHEYGHALTALFFGGRPSITLEAFGGYAEYEGHAMSPKQRFIITLNGPLLESLLIVIPYYLLKTGVFADHMYVQYTLYATMKLNIIWCLLNLIPLAPLDGGYLMRYMLERRFGANGFKASIIVGLVCAAGAVPYLFSQGFFFFAILLAFFALQNFQMLQKSGVSSRKESQFNSYLNGVEAIKNNNTEKGKEILKKLLKSKNASVKHSAIESIAKVYMDEKEDQRAYELLLKADPEFLKEGKCLLCRLAFDRQNYEVITKYSRDIYAIEPTYETALLNAKAFAHLNDPLLAGGWLETASLFGEEYIERLKRDLLDEAFECVKDHEEFSRYAKKLDVLDLIKS